MMSWSIQSFAQVYACSSDKRTKVFLLGTFHFAQTDSSYNVLDAKHQRSIKKLCKIIEKTNPNKVFVERQPEFEYTNRIDSMYNHYVQTNELPKKKDSNVSKNEIYQVGFRVAKSLGHSQVYQCDHPGRYGMYFEECAAYAELNNQNDILYARAIGTTERADNIINEDSIKINSSLLNYLRWLNSDHLMKTSHARYITTFPQVGSPDFYNYEDDDTLIGAELLADWYRRNILIYSKIINQLDYSEEAIFLIIGGDHIPIIQDLFEDNPHFNVIYADQWLSN